MSKGNLSRWLLLAVTGIVLAACQTTTAHKPEQGISNISGSRVVVMPFDVELSELTAGGATEPRADWTAQAEEHIRTLLDKRLDTASVRIVQSSDSEKSESFITEEKRVVKFHALVGANILTHKYHPFFLLPTKKEKFDWTLAEKANVLRAQYDADYALFVFVRDSYATAGRAAVIAVGALFGVGIQGGQQVGYASLVDLKTGEVEWFNFLHSTTGDLRKLEAADKAVNGLMSDFPA